MLRFPAYIAALSRTRRVVGNGLDVMRIAIRRRMRSMRSSDQAVLPLWKSGIRRSFGLAMWSGMRDSH